MSLEGYACHYIWLVKIGAGFVERHVRAVYKDIVFLYGEKGRKDFKMENE